MGRSVAGFVQSKLELDRHLGNFLRNVLRKLNITRCVGLNVKLAQLTSYTWWEVEEVNIERPGFAGQHECFMALNQFRKISKRVHFLVDLPSKTLSAIILPQGPKLDCISPTPARIAPVSEIVLGTSLSPIKKIFCSCRVRLP